MNHILGVYTFEGWMTSGFPTRTLATSVSICRLLEQPGVTSNFLNENTALRDVA